MKQHLSKKSVLKAALLVILAVLSAALTACGEEKPTAPSLVIMDSSEIEMVSYSLKDGKLTLKLKLNEEGVHLGHMSAVVDTPRLVLGFYKSEAQGIFVSDEAGIYTLDINLPNGITTIIQEVPGNEKPLIENIDA